MSIKFDQVIMDQDDYDALVSRDKTWKNCTEEQADAWMAVWEELKAGNPQFYQGPNWSGKVCAIAEIKRLYEFERTLRAAAWPKTPVSP